MFLKNGAFLYKNFETSLRAIIVFKCFSNVVIAKTTPPFDNVPVENFVQCARKEDKS